MTLELIQCIASGDHRAAEELFRSKSKQIWGILWYRGGKRLPAGLELEDLYQEIWEELLRSARSAPPQVNFGGWITTIIQRILSRQIRNSNQLPASLSNMEDPRSFFGRLLEDKPRKSASFRASQLESLILLLEKVEELPKQHRETFYQFWFEERSWGEIGATQDRTPDAVRVNLDRIHRQLRKQLEDLESEPPTQWASME
ncbi:MAG: sigma-70 family RNA polymerase sigma factor [Planctomycetota bacterium]|nr:MAG: sigma-70 family RNA polymerase sigma factor [Planctomycetota bacterium]